MPRKAAPLPPADAPGTDDHRECAPALHGSGPGCRCPCVQLAHRNVLPANGPMNTVFLISFIVRNAQMNTGSADPKGSVCPDTLVEKASVEKHGSGTAATLWMYSRSAWAAGAIMLLLFLRRPDALLNPQFFAEDGVVFFHDQLLFGLWESLWIPHGGYLLIVQRLTAWWASFFPPIFAPA